MNHDARPSAAATLADLGVGIRGVNRAMQRAAVIRSLALGLRPQAARERWITTAPGREVGQ